MKNLIKSLLPVSEPKKFHILFLGTIFLPLFALSQSNTTQSQTENSPQVSKQEFVMPSQTGNDQNKTEKWSEEKRYKVEKRNKKVGKMKVEQCEDKELEKGTGKRETKEICEPKK